MSADYSFSQQQEAELDIYLHASAHTAMRDAFEEKKTKNPSFSLRSWSNSLGMASHGGLQQVLAGKRAIPKKYIPKIISSLGFSPKEGLYFETLVDFERAKSSQAREVYYERLVSLRPSKREISVLEIEHHKYFRNPLHILLPTLVERPDFRYDYAWMQKKLRIATSQRELKEVVKRLLQLEILAEKDGTLVPLKSNIQNKVDVPSDAVHEFHRVMSGHAGEQIKKQKVDEKEYNSFCFNLKKADMRKAKTKIRKFIHEFLSEFDAHDSPGTEMVHLNTQLFCLTQPVRKHKNIDLGEEYV